MIATVEVPNFVEQSRFPPTDVKFDNAKIPSDGGNPPKPKTQEPPEYTNNRIYVSNIPFSFRDNDLISLFSPFGKVESAMIVCNERGSKGFGFVTMDSIESCERARVSLHGKKILGRTIEVRKATSPPKARQGQQQQQQQFARSPAPHVATASPISNAVPSLAGLQSNLLQNHLQQQTMNMFLAQHPLVLQSILSASAAQNNLFNPLLGQQTLAFPTLGGSFPLSYAQTTPISQPFAYRVANPLQTQGMGIGGGLGTYGSFPVPLGTMTSANKSASPPSSLNNSQLSNSFTSHARLMQDQLVNFLNLDGTLNNSIYLDQSRLTTSGLNRSLLNGSSDSDDSKNNRKRAGNPETRADFKVLRK